MENEQRGVYYAPADCLGVWRRLLIDIVDFGVTLFAMVVLSMIVAAVLRDALAYLLIVTICLGVWITYFVFLKGSLRTLGYLIAGARIVNLQGELPSYRALALRLVFALLGLFLTATLYPFDLLWLSSDPRRQALRDKVTRTYVIRANAQPAGSGPIVYGFATIAGGGLLFAEVSDSRGERESPRE